MITVIVYQLPARVRFTVQTRLRYRICAMQVLESQCHKSKKLKKTLPPAKKLNVVVILAASTLGNGDSIALDPTIVK